MNTYEYKTIKIEGKGFFATFESDKLLNEYGAEGWKIISSLQNKWVAIQFQYIIL